MGVHLHKAIGWAVACVEDPVDRYSEAANQTLADHAGWLRCKALAVTDEDTRDEILHEADLLEKSRTSFLDQCVIHIPQLNEGTLILIPPAHLKDWSRMDDDLDCAFMEGEHIQDRIVYTRSNPYSFSHLWMDAPTGRPLVGPGGDAVARAGLPRGDEGSMRLRFPGEDKPAFSDPWEAANRLAPGVPREIRHLAEHLGAHLPPILDLRPARAVWMG